MQPFRGIYGILTAPFDEGLVRAPGGHALDEIDHKELDRILKALEPDFLI